MTIPSSASGLNTPAVFEHLVEPFSQLFRRISEENRIPIQTRNLLIAKLMSSEIRLSDAESTSKDFLIVRTEGKRRGRRALKHNNLRAVISIGYRVHSRRAVRFRQWAIRTLREHLFSGNTMNGQRLSERGLDLLSRTLKNQALVHDSPHRRYSGRIRRMSRLAESIAEEAADTTPPSYSDDTSAPEYPAPYLPLLPER